MHAPHFVEVPGEVPGLADFAVRHLDIRLERGFGSGHIDHVLERGDSALDLRIARVHGADSIDGESVGVEVGGQRTHR